MLHFYTVGLSFSYLCSAGHLITQLICEEHDHDHGPPAPSDPVENIIDGGESYGLEVGF